MAISGEDANNEESESLWRQLQTHKKNLRYLQEQKARHGLDVPIRLINEIDEEETAIQEIEERIRQKRPPKVKPRPRTPGRTPQTRRRFIPSYIWILVSLGVVVILCAFVGVLNWARLSRINFTNIFVPEATVGILTTVTAVPIIDPIIPPTATSLIASVTPQLTVPSTVPLGDTLAATTAPSSPTVASGETILCSIDAVAETDPYTFMANAGDRVLFRMTETSDTFEPEVRIFKPDGEFLCSRWDPALAEHQCSLESAGTYTILAGDQGGNHTGSYNLYLQRTNSP